MTNAAFQLLDIKGVIAATTLSRSSVYRAVAAGTLPPPIKISARRSAWRSTDVAAWLEKMAGGVQ